MMLIVDLSRIRAAPSARLGHLAFEGQGTFASQWRCCRTLAAADSQRESMRLDRPHEQAITCPLPHDELVQLHRLTSQARVFADLAGQGDGLDRAA